MKKIFICSILCIFYFILLNISFLKDVDANFLFQPEGCEFSVEFPNKPNINRIFLKGIGEIKQAEYKFGKGPNDAYFLRAEGFAIPKQLVSVMKNKEYLIESMSRYVESNGIENAEYKYYEDKLGNGVVMRGFKKLSGISVTYSGLAHLGKSSIIFLYVGSASKIFPTKEIIEFLKSIKSENSKLLK